MAGVWTISAASPLELTASKPEHRLSASAREFFETKIRPVLVEKCYGCHSANAKRLHGGLYLDSKAGLLAGGDGGPVVVPGDPAASRLITALRYDDAEFQMPPAGKLPSAVVADFVRWIELGVPDPRSGPAGAAPRDTAEALDLESARQFWAFRAHRASDPPAVRAETWCRSPIDRFVIARLEEAGLAPAPEADPLTLLRRVTFDLTGLPPTRAEIDAYLADDDPGAYERAIDRLLASPRYGERWGRHWLDVARYADSNGVDENLAYANAFRYRDYVIAAFNEDLPYDEFVREQIAGDLIPPIEAADDEVERVAFRRRVATGFLSIGPKMLACDDGRKMELDIVDEQVDTLSRAFMGITMGCARCHDHKFDPISSRDYYALAGIFKSTKTMENFKVVAEWHEHELATRADREKLAAIEKRVSEIRRNVEARESAAKAKLLHGARSRLAEYVFAAAQTALRTGPAPADGSASIGSTISPADFASGPLRGRGALFEAEAFQRGSLSVDRTNWGSKVGVLLHVGFVEYDLDLPPGRYQLELRYAAADSRPVAISIDGKTVLEDGAKGVTGGWYPKHQRWHLEGVFELARERTILRLERTAGPVPHIDKVLLVRVAESPRAKDDGETEAAPLVPAFVTAWIAHVRALREVEPWRSWAGLSPSDRDAKLTELAEALRGGGSPSLAPVVEALRKAASDVKAGPFRLGKDPRALFPASEREALTRFDEDKNELEKAKPVFPRAMGVRDGKVEDLRVHIRGNYLTLGEDAPRGFPEVFSTGLPAAIASDRSGRLELAEWLASPEHPLTARVMVNRVWLWHFGEGIVRSPDNFGRLGERPTHPALLDWLANRFVELGWSIKDLHREILTSSTYRMGTQFDPRANEIDPENRLRWRFDRRRLSAEEIRDSLLAFGGELDVAIGGQLMPDKNRAYVTGTGSKEGTYDFSRRSVYLPILRSAVYQVFQTFDFADPSVPAGERASTTVAPQALFMMNGKIVLEQTLSAAKSLLARRELDDGARVRALYWTLYGRPARADEVDRGLAFVRDYASALKGTGDARDADGIRRRAWQGLCRVLVAASEFVYLD